MSSYTVAELEKKLAAMAYIVVRHGEVYAPQMERLEQEIEERRKKGSVRDRAREILRASMASEGRHAHTA
ncbi:hypothetical protein [Neoaquamicrobium sediminum]|uniref:hypothetical protein n=1 Tax=Neoaquamicrobium sediminum TaxID=1849104 RepID=UPI003BAC1C61